MKFLMSARINKELAKNSERHYEILKVTRTSKICFKGLRFVHPPLISLIVQHVTSSAREVDWILKRPTFAK